MKKLLALILAIVLCVALATTALAAGTTEYVSFEWAEAAATEAALLYDARFSQGHEYWGVEIVSEISNVEKYHVFWFTYFSTGIHPESDAFIYVGERSGDVYYDYYQQPFPLYKKGSSPTKLMHSWETAYRDLLTLNESDIIRYNNGAGAVSLRDINGDNIPELLFWVSNGKPANEADLKIYTYHGEKAVEIFSSPAYREAQMEPAAIPFMSGLDFWVWIFNPSESGVVNEYRRYTLTNGTLTLAQTVSSTSSEAATLGQLFNRQATQIFENDALPTWFYNGYYNGIYHYIAQRGTIAPSAVTATPTNTTFMLHNAEVSLPAYLIDGNNYVKLRDVAALLVNRFDVRWEDGKAKLYNQQTYVSVGGELAPMAAGAKTATVSTTDFVWGNTGAAVTGLSAYLIDGNNYIKLRDIAKLFDFDVDWRDGKAWIEPDVSPYTED